ncbi:MAG: hypothetical protein ACRC46_03725 [Thermoguttaceae bacterium]
MPQEAVATSALGGILSPSCTPSLDPRLRALLAHWDSLPEHLRETLFRQFSEAVVLQSVAQESIHSL